MKKDYPAIAKITRPTLPDVFPRQRLFKLMDQGRRFPVTWITGPPGSGKTTLIASYIDSKKLPCLWYQVDEGDGDIATFFYYLGLAGKKAAPRKRTPLPFLTPEYLLGISTFTKRYFEELYSRLRLPSVIVFDNYQKIAAESPFHEVIVYGLTDLPEGINVIVISRAEPPQTFARIRASNKLKIIDWEDLQLTEEETEGFVGLYGKRTKETIMHVHQQTQGWAAGLVLMMEKAKTEDISPQLLSKCTQKEIFEYFAEEIFKKLDKETDDFLLRTAFLPSVITPYIADKLAGHDNADHILSSLSRSHFFTEMRSTVEDAYQYHPLFREFLLSRAAEIFTPAAVAEIKRKAAELLEESDQIGDAAELYIEAGEWDRLVKLILNHAQDMVMHGRNKTLDNWLSRMPRETVVANPWLNYWLGVCRMPCSFQESRACFERAYEIFKEQKNAEGLFLSWFGVIDTYVHQMTDFSPLVYWISEIEKLLKECPGFPSPEARARATAGIFYAMMYGQPHHPDFPLWEERLREGLLTMEDVYFRVVISNHLIIYYSWFNGEQAKAEILIKNLHTTFSRLSETQPFAYIEFRSKEAAHLMMTGRNDLAREALDNAFTTAETRGIHIWDFWLCIQGVNISLSDGDLKKARQFLEKIGQILNPERRAEAAYYYHQLSWESLCLGDPNAALEHARMSLKMCIESGMHLSQGIVMSGLAEALFELGRYDEAITYIEDARAMGRRFKGYMIEYHALLVRTRIFLRTGKTGAALESLSGHLRIGRECGMYNNLFWRSSAMAEICSKALEEGIEVDYVQELIRRRGLNPPLPPFGKGKMGEIWIEHWPWAFKVHTLGRFGLLKDGKPVAFSGKVQKKPLEMLKFLIACGGRDVSDERITEALWPDAEGDAAHQSFETTLHRLRELIGVEQAIERRGGRVTLDPRYWWVDVWAFERMFAEAESVRRETEGEKGEHTEGARGRKGEKEKKAKTPSRTVTRSPDVQNLEKAINIYQGRFLAGDGDKPWLIPMRERLQSRFIRLVGKLGHSYEQAGQWDKAVECYEKALDVDNLAEEFYQRLMVCHHHRGRVAEAVKVHNQCRTVLAAAFGIEPSEEMEAIYRTLTGKRRT